MRMSLKRILFFTYLAICAFLSFINFRTSTDRIDRIDIDSDDDRRILSDQNASMGFWQALKTGFMQELAYVLPGVAFFKKSSSSDEDVEILDDSVWPEDSNISDRILAQILLNPGDDRAEKILIYLPHGLRAWNVEKGNQEFERHKCQISNCFLTDSKSDSERSDAVVFRNHYMGGFERKSQKQIWIFYTLESPDNTPSLSMFKNTINWTATYRFDSDLVTPYEKYRRYSRQESKIRNLRIAPKNSNYASGKSKHIAWFVSNCLTSNRRHEYAHRLSEYLKIDIYGTCGPLKCSRKDPNCGRMLNEEYRFYLAFENSNCRDYITEKFFVQGLQHNVIPIVMGARKSDYIRTAPPNSFIHVDDFRTPAELAAYLLKLSKNETLYNEYFKWKGAGEFINTKFWCRLCAMLNAPKSKFYVDLERWWRSPGICTSGHWKDSVARNGALHKNHTNISKKH